MLGEIEATPEDRLVLTGLPIARTREHYREAIDDAVSELGDSSGVLAVYQIGGVSAPGISDIDIIVVLDDRVPNPPDSGCYCPRRLDRYLYMHGLFAMPSEVFKRRALLTPMNSLTLLHGEDIKEELAVGQDDARILGDVHAIEYLIAALFDLSRQFYYARLKVRALLCSLNALVYDFDALVRFGGSKAYRDFASELAELRGSWFEDQQLSLESFLGLARRTPRLVLGMLDSVARAGQVPFDSVLGLQVGTNGYVRATSGANVRTALLGHETVIGRLIRLGPSLLLPDKVSRHLIDLGQGFTGYSLGLSPEEKAPASGVPVRVLQERARLLSDYWTYMRLHADPRFAVYDVLRWDARLSRKWNAIRRLNRIVVGPRALDTGRPT
jgi:hypothetical protein